MSVFVSDPNDEYIVSPRVRKIDLSRRIDLRYLPETHRSAVEQALASRPVDPGTGTPVRSRMRRVLLGPRGELFEPGNQFFKRLSGGKEGTEAQYASAVRLWLDACASQGTDPLAMTYETLLEYRDDVRMDLDGVAATTWNQGLSALRRFADIGHSCGLMEAVPDADWRMLRLDARNARHPRVVSGQVYRRFRTVGIQGMLLSGDYGPAADRILTPVRDTLYADFLLSHGTRRAEACHLTLLDLPERREGYGRNVGFLPGPICKRNAGRDFQEVRAWADRLAAYHDTEWLTTVRNAQAALRRAEKAGKLLVVRNVSDRFGSPMLSIAGQSGRKSLLNLSKAQRRALVCTPEVIRKIRLEAGMGRGLALVDADWLVPLAIFPGTRSPMLSPEAWSMTFREANMRVAVALEDAGQPPVRRTTPHMLRHTFATEWLSAELKRIAAADAGFAQAVQDGDITQLRRRHFNPLLGIKDLLGHERLETTLLYVDYLMREEQSTYISADSWIESYIAAVP